MRTIEAVTAIAATPRKVWDVLTDFPKYPLWTTYIQRLEGRPVVGSRLKVVLGPPGRRPYVVHAPVLEATPGARLAWAAVIPGAGWLPRAIYTGVHEFVLSAVADGGTRLTHREHFGGLLARLVKEGPRGADEGFTAFNQALKARAESLPTGRR
ncbi:SRPBCC domain-containing protein [Virgisporangium aliadipatigenens]|uniref:SRPBCC domain-containing protein n=1 Tax=Virgisporangium aliadipatigenens TaxID=741659 RepID=UPI001945B42B|nr:SRPBCC domain-containing protein [Virgisporangium aliadipatigenens]